MPGQPPGYPPQGGFPGYPGGPGAPGGRNRALPWILAGGGVVVVGVVVGLLFVFGVFGGGGPNSSPDAVAAALADALNTHNDNEAQAITCGGGSGGNFSDNQALQQMKNDAATIRATVTGKAQVNGNSATSTLHLTFTGGGQTIELDGTLSMQKQNGKWCAPANGFQPNVSSMKINGQSPGNFGPGASGVPGVPGTGAPGFPGGGPSGLPSAPSLPSAGPTPTL